MQMIYQSEAAECGLACITMIADYHGHQINLATVRSRYAVSLKGANLQHLLQLADQLNLAGRALRLEIEELGQLSLPCVLHWNMNHFVVLKKVSKHSIVILDPAQGERKVPMSEVSDCFSGIALELQPTSEFNPRDEKVRLGLNAFWRRIDGLMPALSKIFLLSVLLQVFVLAAPYYLQLVVDDVLISMDQPLLYVLAMGFGLLMLVRVVTQALRSWLVLYLGSTMSMQMATNLFRHLVHLPLGYFEKRHIGDIVSRFGSLAKVRELMTSSLVEGLIDGIMAIGVLVMMYIYSPLLAAVVFTAVILYAFIRWVLYQPMRERTEASIMASAKEQSNFMETVRGMQSIKLFGKQSQRMSIWQNRYAESVNQQFLLGKWQISYQTVNQLLFGIENTLVVMLGALAVIKGSLSVGMLFAFMTYKTQFTERMASLIDKLVQLFMTRLHLERLADIALTEKESDDAAGMYREISGEITVQNASYRYSATDPLLFDQLNFSITAGESVAIIGPSGSGKTTLAKVMLGLLPTTDGKILADGVDIRLLGLGHFRQQVAAVMQQDQLLSGTLAENIAFFDPNMDLPWVEQCAVMAGIHRDIEAMPMGYNALIGDMGSSLSGGQRQRLYLARALYKRPKILFLDEATSSLDIQLESHVNDAIKALCITRIIIAHRPETINSADRILLLCNGKLMDVTEQYNRDRYKNIA
ncbi:peptidase domain-containing ABC transporter [Rheinheimera baltica]|uniref:peptidase domain-containing ABC transporter n=1 Tax=Rheinheimera baltica TaxID=67576 RepID=UPI0027401CC6|nr:peptidase domain-containing ABC transporter [Rheinheimera baltica]MDP5151889.1 peptidase domain-containing ABC transporter [Rheinheimera baltica]MDP5189810.1 peptidase domain-containing ABC transporter [Rheinheimera baltica]